MKKKKRGFKMPHVYIIIFTFILIMSILTYVIPAGEYDRIERDDGRMMVDPTSYHRVESNPTTILDLFTAIPRGFEESGLVIAFTLILAGTFEVIKTTGVLTIAVENLSNKLADKGILIIPVLMILFGGLASFVGTPELSMVYVPIILPLMLMLGFDSLTALATALVATAAGFTAALTNPFTVGIAQEIAGLPPFSGMGFRVFVLVLVLGTGIIYVMRHAKKVHANPQDSLVYEKDQLKRKELEKNKSTESVKLNTRQKLAGISSILGFAIVVFGILKYSWGMDEMAGVFVAIGIFSGLMGGLKGGEIADSFVEGAQGVLMGGILIGMARAVTIIMEDALIMDTVVYGMSKAIQTLPASINAVGMLVVQTLFNFLVPSGSGQAVITMPILSPLADLVGVNQQVAVLALQFGDGLSNIIYPTSGYFMATLAIAKVDWDKWAKFIMPLLTFWTILSAGILIFAQAINYGPF